MVIVFIQLSLELYHMVRNARFGPLTLLMTLRVMNVKSDDKFTQLFYVSIHDADIRFKAEAVVIGTDITQTLLQTIYNESALSKEFLILNNNLVKS